MSVSVDFVQLYEIKCSHGNNLYSLYCRFNYIEDNKTLKADMPVKFQNYTKYVTQLTIDISNLTTLPADTFDVLPNLHTLVARADFRTLTKKQFIHATKLSILNFGFNNQLTVLEAYLFKYVKQLESIDLGFNQIHTIEDNAFHGLSKLKQLYLEANLLSTLTNDTLAGINVELLELSRNQIDKIESGAFQHLSKLKRLQLNRNRIGQLPPSIFKGLRSIERIDLAQNLISELDDDVFEDLPTLLILELGFNRIVSLPDSVFDGAPNLNSLFLAYNTIVNIETPFQNLTELKLLDLSYNQIEFIEPSAFSSMARLESLEIRSCNLSVLDENLFNEQNQLESLDLSENSLTELDLTVFGALKKLRFLKLEANRISELNNFTDIKSLMPSLQFINLARNEIDCDSVAEMIEYLTANNVLYEFGEEVDVGCRLLPFQSRALQAYQLSHAEFYNKVN